MMTDTQLQTLLTTLTACGLKVAPDHVALEGDTLTVGGYSITERESDSPSSINGNPRKVFDVTLTEPSSAVGNEHGQDAGELTRVLAVGIDSFYRAAAEIAANEARVKANEVLNTVVAKALNSRSLNPAQGFKILGLRQAPRQTAEAFSTGSFDLNLAHTVGQVFNELGFKIKPGSESVDNLTQENDVLVVGDFSIYENNIEQPTIRGPVLAKSYDVTVMIQTGGSRWQPPDADEITIVKGAPSLWTAIEEIAAEEGRQKFDGVLEGEIYRQEQAELEAMRPEIERAMRDA